MLLFMDNVGAPSCGAADDFAPLLEELEHATDEHPDLDAETRRMRGLRQGMTELFGRGDDRERR